MQLDIETGEISDEKCSYGAPFFAFERTPKRFGVVQGCCNHWDCPRCGQMVARKHYGRIVEGARGLEKQGVKLAFMTITCRGKELPANEAFKNYLEWTNRLLDAMRARSQRVTKNHPREAWAYCQVTEKQTRSHPHSHILISYMPEDTVLGYVTKYGANGAYDVPALRSDWLEGEVVRAGLGKQYDISEAGNIEAVSRYIAKYMFKDSQFKTKFPPNWHRVRYSQTWPELAARKTNAKVLMTIEDWAELSSRAVVVDAQSGAALIMSRRYLQTSGVIVTEMGQSGN